MTKDYFMIKGKKIPMSKETAQSILDSQKKITTYEDVCEKLFLSQKTTHYVGANKFYTTDLSERDLCSITMNGNESTSKKQLQSILNLNKLANVAKYLNDGWLPQFIQINKKATIQIGSGELDIIYTDYGWGVQNSLIYFKSKELAQQAIDILGEDVIKSALTLNH